MAFCSIRILFEEIEKLQIRLNECENDDEKRALEEDITGKVRPVMSHDGLSDGMYNIDPTCMLAWSPQ